LCGGGAAAGGVAAGDVAGATETAAPPSASGPGAAKPLQLPPPTEESIRRSRRPERPGLRALLRTAGRDVTPLSGTGAGERDPGLLLALARFGGAPCVVLGHDRVA